MNFKIAIKKAREFRRSDLFIINYRKVICELREQLKSKEAEIKKIKQYYEELISIDYLTNIANRRAFDEAYRTVCKQAMAYKKPITLIMLDIDYYKDFNDAYGHVWGDECLRKIASELSNTLSESDGFIYRYGGEEFIALLPISDIEKATTIAEDMRSRIENLSIGHRSSKVSEYVTVSIGVASMEMHDTGSAENLLMLADKALYQAKQMGRNQIVANEGIGGSS